MYIMVATVYAYTSGPLAQTVRRLFSLSIDDGHRLRGAAVTGDNALSPSTEQGPSARTPEAPSRRRRPMATGTLRPTAVASG